MIVVDEYPPNCVACRLSNNEYDFYCSVLNKKGSLTTRLEKCPLTCWQSLDTAPKDKTFLVKVTNALNDNFSHSVETAYSLDMNYDEDDAYIIEWLEIPE